MVKKLISGILNKNDKKEDDKKEDVPDELPALGEDSAPEPKQEAPAEAPAAQTSEEQAPDELPGLDDAQEEQPEAQQSQEEEPPEQEHMDAPQAPPRQEKQSLPPSDGFFSHISAMMDRGKIPDGLLSQDLVSNMKENWGIHKESAKTGLSPIQEQTITRQVQDTLTALRLMESKWRAHKIVLDEELSTLKEQELKMKSKEKELKALLRRAKLYQGVPDEKMILLKNSIPVRSISDLVNALGKMDRKTFSSLVTKREHKIAALAGAIDTHLGSELRKASSKQKIQQVLEHYVKRMSS